MRGLLPILIAAGLAASGCGSRERINPFDPGNPQTSGRPSGFVALAADREVTLRWNAVSGTSLAGFRLYRRGPGDTDFRALTDILGPNVTSFRDIPVANGWDYAYRLYYVFASGLGSQPAEDTATPGSARPWLVESGGTDLVRLTPDGRHVLSRRGGFGSTTDVGVNPRNGDVWVTDEGRGTVVVVYPDSGVTVEVAGFSRPRAVAVDAGDGTAWICDQGRNRVYQLRRNGNFVPLSIGPVDVPVDAAVEPVDGFVWLCDLGSGLVARYDASAQQWATAVPGPARVAFDPSAREGWVSSFEHGTVTRLSGLGQVLGTFSGFTAPLGIAVDSQRGRIWVADPYAGRVTALERDGREAFRVTGLADAGELAVDEFTGEAWVVLGTSGAVARISSAGTVLRVQGGLRIPIAIGVDPGNR